MEYPISNLIQRSGYHEDVYKCRNNKNFTAVLN